MSYKSKSTKVIGAARKHAAEAPGGRARAVGRTPEAWEQMAQVPEERDDEIDCQRVVEGDGRRLPLYYDEYN